MIILLTILIALGIIAAFVGFLVGLTWLIDRHPMALLFGFLIAFGAFLLFVVVVGAFTIASAVTQ